MQIIIFWHASILLTRCDRKTGRVQVSGEEYLRLLLLSLNNNNNNNKKKVKVITTNSLFKK